MKYKCFEELPVWKQARELNKIIYEKTKSVKNEFNLVSQIRRSSISISSNIAEGFDKENNKEFKRYLLIAKGSAAEFRSQLYLIKDLDYLKEEDVNTILNMIIEISKQLSGMIKYLRKDKLI